MVRGSVFTHETGSVYAKDHREAGQGDVVNDLIQSALIEGGIDCYKGFNPFGSHACCEGDGMLFGNSDIEKTIRIDGFEFAESGSGCHGSADGNDVWVFFCQPHQAFAKDLAPAFLAAADGSTAFGFEGSDTVKLSRVLFCRAIALAFLGDDVDQHGADHIAFHTLEDGIHLLDIVAVNGSHIFQTEVFKDDIRHQDVHHGFFQFLSTVDEAAAQAGREAVAYVPDLFLEGIIAAAGHHFGHVFLQATHVFGDGHGIVVQDHDKSVGLEMPGVIEGFKAHPSGEGTVSDHSHGMTAFTFKIPRAGNAQGSRDGGAAVPGRKGIARALVPVHEPADAV